MRDRMNSSNKLFSLQRCSIVSMAKFITSSLFLIALIVAIGILIDRGWICLSKHQTKETIVREQIRSTNHVSEKGNLPFVELTVCPSYDFAFKEHMMTRYGLDSNKYRSEGKYTPDNNYYRDVDLREIFDQITHDIHEILQSIKIFTLDHKHDMFLEQFNGNKTETNFVRIITKYQSNLGKCYSIQPKEEVLKFGIRIVELVSKTGIYVYLGYPGQFTHHITKTKAITQLGKRVYLDFTHELSVNKLGDLKSHRCNPAMNTNFDNEMYQHIAEENLKLFGCSVPFHPPSYSRSPNEIIKICRNETNGLKAYHNFESLRNVILSEDFIPCQNFNFFLGMPDIDEKDNDPDEAYIRLYLKTKIKVKSTVLYYDSTTLAAEIGGYIGMLLGVSLVDLVIIANSSILKMIAKKC